MNEERPAATRSSNARRWRTYFDARARSCGVSPEADDHFSRKTFEATRKAVLELIGNQSGKRVLDVGCGNGTFMRPILDRHEVYGVDASPQMCALALASGYQQVTRGDCEHLAFEDGSFDLTVSIGLVQYLHSAEKTIAELARVTRKGSEVVLVTINEESALRGLLSSDRYVRGFSARELSAIFRANGLSELEYQPLFFPLTWTFRTARLSLPVRLAMASFAIKGRKRTGG